MSAEYLTKKQLAEKYGVSARTIQEWMSAGRIGFIKVGGWVRFTPAQVEVFEQEHTYKPITTQGPGRSRNR